MILRLEKILLLVELQLFHGLAEQVRKNSNFLVCSC
jgi:hypothetical protein